MSVDASSSIPTYDTGSSTPLGQKRPDLASAAEGAIQQLDDLGSSTAVAMKKDSSARIVESDIQQSDTKKPSSPYAEAKPRLVIIFAQMAHDQA